MDEIIGQAKDGTIFNAESPEVIAELKKFPELSEEAAIGNVVMAHDKISIKDHVVTKEDVAANEADQNKEVDLEVGDVVGVIEEPQPEINEPLA